MGTAYFDVEGTKIGNDDLRIKDAAGFLKAVENSSFCDAIECKKIDTSTEIVVFETQVERPQRPINDIQYKERLAVHFYIKENILPTVYALRKNFPPVLHVNMMGKEFPRNLCIYEEPFDELKLKWTGVTFLEDIRNWLTQTAVNKLHPDDQLLEPLLMPSSKFLIIPEEILFLDSLPFLTLGISSVTSQSGRETYLLQKKENNNCNSCITFVVKGQPQTHGLIRKHPSNLFEVHEFLTSANIDLLSILRSNLSKFKFDIQRNLQILIIIFLPKKRDDHAGTETFDLYAYWINENIVSVKSKIGIWDICISNTIGVHGIDESIHGMNVKGELLNPILSFTKNIAQLSSDIKDGNNKRITAIGLGTIGSQVFMNLSRMGMDNWNLIDNDILLPHNLARHSLLHDDVGFNKTERLSQMANCLLGCDNIKSIPENVLQPNSYTEMLNDSYRNTDVLLDMSASIPVARKLAIDIESNAKRISAFLSPNGNDCILLCEDDNRTVRLDFLEMVYYRFLLQEANLHSHLERPTERIRFGNSCRDVSFKLPQDLVSIHSGILSRAIRNSINSNVSVVKIWRTELDTINVKEYNCNVYETYSFSKGDWTIITDQYFIDKLKNIRSSKLPNETGGILIGSHDMQRKILYVVDTVSSPKDSIEFPTEYVRGCKGLENNINSIRRITDNNLYYIGEWHSHPKGATCKPSSIDKKAFRSLQHLMSEFGFPALMMIVSKEYDFYLEEIIN